jgi:hypothetical protein
MTAKQIIWIPIIGDIYIVSQVKNLSDLHRFFTSKKQTTLYIIYQTLMWAVYVYGLISLFK